MTSPPLTPVSQTKGSKEGLFSVFQLGQGLSSGADEVTTEDGLRGKSDKVDGGREIPLPSIPRDLRSGLRETDFNGCRNESNSYTRQRSDYVRVYSLYRT